MEPGRPVSDSVPSKLQLRVAEWPASIIREAVPGGGRGCREGAPLELGLNLAAAPLEGFMLQRLARALGERSAAKEHKLRETPPEHF